MLAEAKLAHFMQRHEEMPRVVKKFTEAELYVKRFGIVVQRINFNRANANLIGDLHYTAQRIQQQPRAKPQAVDGTIDGQATQQRHRYKLTRKSFRLICWQYVKFDCVCDESVVSQNYRSAGPCRDERSGHILAVELTSSLLQPIVQAGLAAIESRSVVLLC